MLNRRVVDGRKLEDAVKCYRNDKEFSSLSATPNLAEGCEIGVFVERNLEETLKL